MSLRSRRLVLSAAAAAALLFVPSLIALAVVHATWIDYFEATVLMLAPGMVVAAGVAKNAHLFSPILTLAASFVFWTAILYGVFSLLHTEPRKPHA